MDIILLIGIGFTLAAVTLDCKRSPVRLAGRGGMTLVTVRSDSRLNAEFIRQDKAARYVQMLIRSKLSPEDIDVERDGIELDIVEDLGIKIP